MVVWAMATKTQGFAVDHLGTVDQDSLGTQFPIKAVAAPASLWGERFKLRDKAIWHGHGMGMAEYLESLCGRRRNDEPDEDIGSGGEEPREDLANGGADPAAAPHTMQL